MSYLLLVLSIAFAVANNLILHGFHNRGCRGMGDLLLYNAGVSAVWCVVFAILADYTQISAGAVLYGVLYGAVTAYFLLCKMQAMTLGPVAVASFVGCSSLLVSTVFGIIVDKDYPSVLQWVGVVLLLVSLFLTVAPKGGIQNVRKSWIVWCILFLIGGGTVGIIFKLHQRSAVREQINEMMLIASVTSAFLLLLLSFVVTRLQAGKDAPKGEKIPKVGKAALPFLLSCGLVSCAYNRLNVTLVGALPSIVFFPVFNGAVIFCASLLSALLFRERLKAGQYAGLVLGAVALLLASGTLSF